MIDKYVKTYAEQKVILLLFIIVSFYLIIFLPIKIFIPDAGLMVSALGWLALISIAAVGFFFIFKNKSLVESLAADEKYEEAWEVSKKSRKFYLNLTVVSIIVAVLLAMNLPDMIHYTK